MKTHKTYTVKKQDDTGKDWIRKEQRKDMIICFGVIVAGCIVLLILTELLKGSL